MQNIALRISYDGTNFHGWQKQQQQRTVQAELERALLSFTGASLIVTAAGRTDSHVHASYQVVNFYTQIKRELINWQRGLNALLPADIAVYNVANVSADFSARHSAISRTYHYYLLLSPIKATLLHNKVGCYHGDLDIDLMRTAGELLIGEHDFSSFRAAGCQAQTPIRTLMNFTVNDERQNSNACSFMQDLIVSEQARLLCFTFTANSFLYHMVRNIIGALVYVGSKRLTIADFKELCASKNRQFAPPTFMPDGLYLTHVIYPEPIFVPTDNQ